MHLSRLNFPVNSASIGYYINRNTMCFPVIHHARNTLIGIASVIYNLYIRYN